MLTTLEHVKAWLGVQSVSDDALLTRLIESASALIESYLQRTLAHQPYSETRNGCGKPIMLFGHYPVSAVESVKVNGREIAPSAGFGLPGYHAERESLLLIGSVFDRGLGNVELRYTAGYAEIPPEIAQACIELVALRYKERDRIGHQSKTLAGETVTFFIGDLPASVKTALAPYRRVAPL